MIFDMHAHVIPGQNAHAGNFLCPKEHMSPGLRLLYKKTTKITGGGPSEERLLQWIEDSAVDRIVLLALDPVYGRDGTKDMANTRVKIDNDFVADLALRSSKVLFGASIHPFRKDAVQELKRLALRGACLVKWIPSAQNIAVDDPSCIPFYKALAKLNMPLLTHTGVEHTLPTFHHRLNDPRRLKTALNCGVRVIGAHCGTRLFLHEASYWSAWKHMALAHENFYGDISTFSLPLHARALRALLKDPVLCSKILYGSDFPALVMPGWYAPVLGLQKARELRRMTNPFDKAYFTLKGMGVPEEVFTRAEEILRLAN